MPKQVLSFHYTLTDEQGKQIDSSTGLSPMLFLEGSGQIIPGLEVELLRMQVGDQKQVNVPYGEAYGAYDQNQVYRVSRKNFPPGDLAVGDAFEMGEGNQYRIITVLEVVNDEVVVDANHPLAGKNLVFQVELINRRDATADELTHGHAHGEGGHHHHH